MKLSRFAIVTLLALGICIPLFDAVTARYPDTRPHVNTGDLVLYSVALLQTKDTLAFEGDTVFANGEMTRATYQNAAVYMWGLKLLHNLYQPDFHRMMHVYYAILIMIYLPGMYILLAEITHHPPVAIGLSIASITPSFLMTTGTHWGFDSQAVLPFSLFTALTPWPVWVAYRHWYKPSAQGQTVNLWIVSLLGLGVGLMLVTVHGISGIPLVGLMIAVALFQALHHRLSWLSIIAFGFGLGLASLAILFQGHLQSMTNEVTFESSKSVIESGQNFMVFPWGNRLASTLALKATEANSGLAIVAYAIGSCGLFIGLWHNRYYRILGVISVIWGIVWQLIFMNTGYLGMVLLIYGIWRVWHHQTDELDVVLAFTLHLAFIFGYVFQPIFYLIWQHFEFISLTALLYETARFAHFAYIPFYLLLSRAIVWAISGWKINHFQFLAAGLWAYTVYKSLNIIPLPRATHFDTLVLVSLILGITGIVLTLDKLQRSPNKALLFVILFMAVLGWSQFHQSRLKESSVASNTFDNIFTPDYLAMTQWVRQNTDQGSLFHLVQSGSHFRYYAHRPLLIAKGEYPVSLYAGANPLAIKALEDTLYSATCIPQDILDVLRRYGVSYVVDHAKADGPCQHIFKAEQAIAFQNQTYIVYEVALIPEQD